MIWGNPLALFGLLGLAVPVIIHLLGRHRSRVQKFPTLRFLTASRLTPTRRKRLNDLLLLAVRMGIVAAAAIALAQPYFESASRTAARETRLGRTISRAIVVDTSASMSRIVDGGERGVGVARREAVTLADEASISTVIETAAPGQSLSGAATWLTGQPGRRELVILSDFQIGTIDAVTLRAVPTGVGVKLIRIATLPTGVTLQSAAGNRAARITVGPDRTEVEWALVERATDLRNTPALLAGAAETPRADAALRAATAIGGIVTVDSARPVAIIYKEYERRPELLRTAKAIDKPWMGDAIAHLHADPTLVAAAATAEVAGDTSIYSDAFATVVRNAAGASVVLATKGANGGRDRLELWVLADAGSLTSAALISAVSRSTSIGAPARELEPEALPSELLRRWERPAGMVGPPAADSESDGRWFWLAALLLLGVETLLRRGSRSGLVPSLGSLAQDDNVGRAA